MRSGAITGRVFLVLIMGTGAAGCTATDWEEAGFVSVFDHNSRQLPVFTVTSFEGEEPVGHVTYRTSVLEHPSESELYTPLGFGALQGSTRFRVESPGFLAWDDAVELDDGSSLDLVFTIRLIPDPQPRTTCELSCQSRTQCSPEAWPGGVDECVADCLERLTLPDPEADPVGDACRSGHAALEWCVGTLTCAEQATYSPGADGDCLAYERFIDRCEAGFD